MLDSSLESRVKYESPTLPYRYLYLPDRAHFLIVQQKTCKCKNYDRFPTWQRVRLVEDPLDRFVAQESLSRSYVVALSGFLVGLYSLAANPLLPDRTLVGDNGPRTDEE